MNKSTSIFTYRGVKKIHDNAVKKLVTDVTTSVTNTYNSGEWNGSSAEKIADEYEIAPKDVKQILTQAKADGLIIGSYGICNYNGSSTKRFITDEMVDKWQELYADGISMHEIAKLAGINVKSAYQVIERAFDERSMYGTYRDRAISEATHRKPTPNEKKGFVFKHYFDLKGEDESNRIRDIQEKVYKKYGHTISRSIIHKYIQELRKKHPEKFSLRIEARDKIGDSDERDAVHEKIYFMYYVENKPLDEIVDYLSTHGYNFKKNSNPMIAQRENERRGGTGTRQACYHCKLSDLQKKAVIQLRESGWTIPKIANVFGVNCVTIDKVLKKNKQANV